MDALPGDPHELVQLLDELAETEPLAVRRWVERHPRNLMAYLGWSVEDFHQAALQDMLTFCQTFWLAPRGSGKSTTALFFCLWLAISDPEHWDPAIKPMFVDAPRRIDPSNIRIAITSNSAEKAGELHFQARAILTDPRLVKLFGKLEGDRWKDHTSTTSLRKQNLKEGTFTALGLGSKVTGGHYDVVLADDWVTEDNARTELRRRRISDFWRFTVRPTHEPWARTIGAGTRYHPQDWYSEVGGWATEGAWNLRRTPALEGGRSYWPTVYPVDILEAIKKEIGEIAFSTQYQNEVGLMLGEFFENSWVERFTRWADLSPERRDRARTIIVLDPAIKAGLRNDFSVFLVLSYLAPYFYVRNVVRGQWTQREILQRASFLVQTYHPMALGVEAVGGMEFLVQELRRMFRRPRVHAMRPQQYRGKDKVGRASQVRTFFEQGRVHLEEPTETNGIQRLILEMMAFPTAANVPGMDDCVDALVWSLLLIARARTRVRTLRRR